MTSFRTIWIVTAVTLISYVAPSPAEPSVFDSELDSIIERIENSLLPPIVLEGAEPEKMSLPDRIEHYQVPGLSVAVVDNFELAWTRAYGVARMGATAPITADTLFQAGSISKALVALLTLKLIDEGHFALDDPVNELLISWRLPDSEAGGHEPVTVRHLISHSAGLNNFTFPFFEPGETLPTLLQALNGEAPAANPKVTRLKPPGNEAEYSNPAFAVLEQLLVDTTGVPFQELAQKKLLEPLGMKNSSFAQSLPAPLFERAAYGHLGDGKILEGKGKILPSAAVGGLWTTPADLGRFLVGILRAHRGDQSAFLSKVLMRKMFQRQIENRGLGVSLEGEDAGTYFSQGGGTVGFLSHVVANPETGQGAAVMVNGGRGSMSLIHELIRSIAVEYAWPDYVREYKIITLSSEAFAKHEGCYEFVRPPGIRMRIYSKDGRYFRGRTEMFPVSETLFLIPEHGDQIEFVVSPVGRSDTFFYGEPGGAKAKALRNDSIPLEECRPRLN